MHSMWANSKALELAGITDSTDDPAGGHIHRDAHGAPTGLLSENANQLLIGCVPQPALANALAAASDESGRGPSGYRSAG